MLSMLKTQIFYVRIKENSFNIRCVNTGENLVLDATTPFSTNRLLIGEFTIAEKLLNKGFKKLIKGFIAPIAVMHPLELVDDKLSEVEEKIFREVALNAGARKVKFWLGDELTDQELLNV